MDLSVCDFAVIRNDCHCKMGIMYVRQTLVTSSGLAYRWSQRKNGWYEIFSPSIDEEGSRHISWAVLKLFVGPRPSQYRREFLACHKDDDRDNNDVSNLYWGTNAENMFDRTRNGNDFNGRIPLEESEILRAVSMYESGMTIKEISERLCIGYGTLHNRISQHIKLRPKGHGMHKKRALTPELEEHAIELFEEGLKYTEIAEELCLSYRQVHRHLYKRYPKYFSSQRKEG